MSFNRKQHSTQRKILTRAAKSIIFLTCIHKNDVRKQNGSVNTSKQGFHDKQTKATNAALKASNSEYSAGHCCGQLKPLLIFDAGSGCHLQGSAGTESVLQIKISKKKWARLRLRLNSATLKVFLRGWRSSPSRLSYGNYSQAFIVYLLICVFTRLTIL